MSGFGGPSDAEVRLALAELIRGDEEWADDLRRELRKVVGWRDNTWVAYPGTSSEHERAKVEVSCEMWDGSLTTYVYDGPFSYLITRLAQVVDDY